MKIRKATQRDIEKINEICLEGLIQEHSLQNPENKKRMKEEVKHDFEFHKKTIKKNLQNKKQYWVVIGGKKIVGFGGAYIKGDKGMIESVYIDKKFQKKGYGIKVMKHLIRWLKSKKVKGIESSFLFNNIPSFNLHKKMGFKPYLLKARLNNKKS